MKTDIQIAQEAKLLPITEVAEQLNISFGLLIYSSIIFNITLFNDFLFSFDINSDYSK